MSICSYCGNHGYNVAPDLSIDFVFFCQHCQWGKTLHGRYRGWNAFRVVTDRDYNGEIRWLHQTLDCWCERANFRSITPTRTQMYFFAPPTDHNIAMLTLRYGDYLTQVIK